MSTGFPKIIYAALVSCQLRLQTVMSIDIDTRASPIVSVAAYSRAAFVSIIHHVSPHLGCNQLLLSQLEESFDADIAVQRPACHVMLLLGSWTLLGSMHLTFGASFPSSG